MSDEPLGLFEKPLSCFTVIIMSNYTFYECYTT